MSHKQIEKKGQPSLSHLSTEQDRYLMEAKILARLPGELCNPLDGDIRGVVEIIHHNGVETPLEELQHRVASDVARSARHQNVRRH